MKLLIDFIKDYCHLIINSTIMGIFTYITLDIKREYKKILQDKTKKDVIKMVVRYINEIYPNDNNKLDKAFTSSKEILKEKGIVISDLELKVLLHNSIYEINNKLEVK